MKKSLPWFITAHFGHHLLGALPSPLLPSIRDTLGLSNFQAQLVTTIYAFASGAGNLPGGKLVNKFGSTVMMTIAIVGVAIMGPIAGGRLVTPQVVGAEDVFEMKPPELALRFVWNNPNVSVAVSGMNTLAMVDENCAAASRLTQMTAEENVQVQALLERNQKLADLYCTGCGYCMPCPNEVNISENFRYMNWYRVWGLEKDAKEAYARLGQPNNWKPYGKVEGLQAAACLECGDCEPKCPQNIHIIEQLKEVASVLGK